MKLSIVITVVLVAGAVLLLLACRKRGPQAEAEAAAARGEYQFIALTDQDGKWTRPQVPGIPEWYFETTGIRIVPTKPETKEADLAYMKSYNEALYQTLKAQGKFHIIEENVARVRKNLDELEKKLSRS